MSDTTEETENIFVKEIVSALKESDTLDDYPKRAVPLGTFARSSRFNKLGVIIDAFLQPASYNEDKENTIIYTLLLFPTGYAVTPQENCFVINESEYETVCYLMMPPVKLREFLRYVSGETLV